MRYAYLIIANRNPNQLQKLITMLDDSRNDIYLMFDKKSNITSVKFHVNYSTINYVKPVDIYWGNYSQIQAELCLFKAAAPEHYVYYHLLSGVDLPLVNQDVIHDFFDKHLNQEFLTYGDPNNLNHIDMRIKHHLFRKYYYKNNLFFKLYRRLEYNFLRFIPLRKISKKKVGYASQWITIDDKLVQLILKNVKLIYYIFKYGYLVDELFIPTLINIYPKFVKRVYYKKPMHNIPNEFQGNLRYINWWDGSPYVWHLKDYKKLIKARQMGHLFSRKFDSTIDNRIVNKIFSNVMKS